MKLAGLLSLLSIILQAISAQKCGGAAGNCALDKCCSEHGWCGLSDDYCNPSKGCQKEFGRCGIGADDSDAASSSGGSASSKRPSSSTSVDIPQMTYGTYPAAVARPLTQCAANSASNGRKVGYYQGQHAAADCNAVPPQSIDSNGYTHLVFAFANFDSETFQVKPGHPDDIKLYSSFVKHQTAKSSNAKALETWLSIGGGSFPASKWASMAASASGRSVFAKSLKRFLVTYGFSGVDIDWELPSGPEDRASYTELIRAIRREFDSSTSFRYRRTTKRLGISLALPSDPYDLRSFDPVGLLSAGADFLNFMAYDYHRYTASTPTLQAHTDARAISQGLEALLATGVDPSRINLGLAMYAYGYSLPSRASPDAASATVGANSHRDTCLHLACPAAGPSPPSACSRDPTGALMQFEIDALIGRCRRAGAGGAQAVSALPAEALAPQANASALVKQLVFGEDGSSFVAFDDAETRAWKVRWADEMCLGGWMLWSLDMGAQKPGGQGAGAELAVVVAS